VNTRKVKHYVLRMNIGGSIPPNPEKELKLWRDVPFKNTVKHSSGRLISMPPEKPDYGQWDVSSAMKAEIGEVSKAVFGRKIEAFPIGDYRICWFVFDTVA
jgi:hypothetical protein